MAESGNPKRIKLDGASRRPISPGSVGLNSLGASWVLDKDRSESLMPYLRLMGLSEMAIEAWTKAEKETDTFKEIEFLMNPKSVRTGVRILKRDRVQNATEEYSFGVEMKYESKVKGAHKKTVVTSENISQLQIKSELPLKNGCTCILVESLSTQEEQGNILMHQVLYSTNVKPGQKGHHASVTTNRYYRKTDPLPEDDELEDEEL
mmetsp:Transcript_5001/g.6459  ORF Transcript_5001/g.6459 Transcript_5001/m.6459 type:complete len:206 (+) Transcript_5001:39-656(+)